MEGDAFARKEAAMTWTLFTPQQQRGAQLHNRAQPGEAVKDRAAQDHEQAVSVTQPGEAPASRLEDRDEDVTPTARDPRVDWDDVVQPEKQVGEASHDDPMVPEGK
jgi:hypothetical protein